MPQAAQDGEPRAAAPGAGPDQELCPGCGEAEDAANALPDWDQRPALREAALAQVSHDPSRAKRLIDRAGRDDPSWTAESQQNQALENWRWPQLSAIQTSPWPSSASSRPNRREMPHGAM
jgi:hypothetical protein